MENTYKYIKAENILNGINDEYHLSNGEIAKLFDFYVIHSVYDHCFKRKDLTKDYGWNIKLLKPNFNRLIDLKRLFFNDDYNYDSIDFKNYSLEKVCILSNDNGNEIKTFLTIVRHFLCHSCYHTVYSSSNEKMVLFQTNDKYNVTSRGIIKLKTLFNIVDLISSNKTNN